MPSWQDFVDFDMEVTENYAPIKLAYMKHPGNLETKSFRVYLAFKLNFRTFYLNFNYPILFINQFSVLLLVFYVIYQTRKTVCGPHFRIPRSTWCIMQQSTRLEVLVVISWSVFPRAVWMFLYKHTYSSNVTWNRERSKFTRFFTACNKIKSDKL